jgi:hypothetical protein
VWREYGTVVVRGSGGSRKKFPTFRGPLVFGGLTLKPSKIRPMFDGWLIFNGCIHNFQWRKNRQKLLYPSEKLPLSCSVNAGDAWHEVFIARISRCVQVRR